MELGEDYKVLRKSKSEREEAVLIPNTVLRWTLPAEGWCKLNAHATCVGGINRSAIGGVIRDENGRWLTGYSGSSEIGTIFIAELRAIKQGLVLAWTMDVKQLVVEINSVAAACALWDTTSDGEDIYPIIRDCKNILTRDWIVKIQFQPLSRNRVLQKLASLGLHDPRELVIFPDPPFAVMHLLLEDYRLMISENRAISLPEVKQTIIPKKKVKERKLG